MSDKRTNLCIIYNELNVFLNGSIDSMVFSTREGVGLTSRSTSALTQDSATIPVHSRIFAQFCNIGVHVLNNRTPEGMKEPKTGYSFPGELCLRDSDTHCPRITGVGYDRFVPSTYDSS